MQKASASRGRKRLVAVLELGRVTFHPLLKALFYKRIMSALVSSRWKRKRVEEIKKKAQSSRENHIRPRKVSKQLFNPRHKGSHVLSDSFLQVITAEKMQCVLD